MPSTKKARAIGFNHVRRQGPDDGRHFGLVVDDKQVRKNAAAIKELATKGMEP